MSGKNRSEVVNEVKGELKSPDFPEDFKVSYKVTVSQSGDQPLNTETLGEQVMRGIKENGL